MFSNNINTNNVIQNLTKNSKIKGSIVINERKNNKINQFLGVFNINYG